MGDGGERRDGGRQGRYPYTPVAHVVTSRESAVLQIGLPLTPLAHRTSGSVVSSEVLPRLPGRPPTGGGSPFPTRRARVDRGGSGDGGTGSGRTGQDASSTWSSTRTSGSPTTTPCSVTDGRSTRVRPTENSVSTPVSVRSHPSDFVSRGVDGVDMSPTLPLSRTSPPSPPPVLLTSSPRRVPDGHRYRQSFPRTPQG